MIQELTPQTDFSQSNEAKQYAETVVSPWFRHACKIALAQFAMDTPAKEGLENACRAHYELIGAKRFLAKLLNLAEPQQQAPPLPQDNLVPWTPPPKTKATPLKLKVPKP